MNGANTRSGTGLVRLVGAGPGDPELLTVKAARAIAEADVVVFDRLVSGAILDLVPPGTRRIDVGKSTGHHPVPQEAINALLIALARAGHRVVRLKGGDPFLFGRGGEEALALRAAGIGVEVVPGITSAQGCAASLGVPLTHRTLASGVRFVTGHARAGAELDLDWDGLADPDTTLVVYMGLASIGAIATQLISAGRGPATAVLAVSRGTLHDQRAVTTTLERLSRETDHLDLPSPTLFIVGEVARLAQSKPVSEHDPCHEPPHRALVAAE
ncbi:MAG: uroporphyrinogen-III C-methyltransferase [Pseudomonadota bacterium]